MELVHQRLRRNTVLDSRGMPMMPKSRKHRECAVTSTALRLESVWNRGNRMTPIADTTTLDEHCGKTLSSTVRRLNSGQPFSSPNRMAISVSCTARDETLADKRGTQVSTVSNLYASPNCGQEEQVTFFNLEG